MPNTVPLVLFRTQHGSYTSFNRLNADFSIQFITLTIRPWKRKGQQARDCVTYLFVMPNNIVVWLQVLHFVVSHVDVFISILQDRQAVHSSGSLQELGLVTGIVCNMGLTEVALTADGELGQEQIQLRGPLARIQRLMIGLLPRYCSSDSWEKVIWLSLTFQRRQRGRVV